jgi:hypothetical protein
MFCALMLAALAAAPLLAAGSRQRAVLHPNPEKVTISGTVSDATTGQGLKGAFVTSGNMSAVTDDAGHYSLTCILTSDATASRVGYVSVKKPINATIVDFALPQTPSVTVKLTSGETVVFDYASTKFGYVIIFQGYAAGDGLNACKIGDPDWQPTKAEMSKITGPARAVNSSCCDRGPVMAVEVEMKSGEKTTAYLNDNCFGYQVDVFGFERSSGTAKYFHLTDVAEIDFP